MYGTVHMLVVMHRKKKDMITPQSIDCCKISGDDEESLIEVNWLQCKNPRCKRWHKLPNNQTKMNISRPFYCILNTWDNNQTSCDLPQSFNYSYEEIVSSVEEEVVECEVQERKYRTRRHRESVFSKESSSKTLFTSELLGRKILIQIGDGKPFEAKVKDFSVVGGKHLLTIGKNNQFWTDLNSLDVKLQFIDNFK